jgi:hypothetical protein
LERLSPQKRSSLLGLIVSDEGKKFYNIDTSRQCFETFFFVTHSKLEHIYPASFLELDKYMKREGCGSK